MTKECFKCHRVLPIDEFYTHPFMADGHLNKCRECTRCDTMQNRRANADHYREYDRRRSGRDDRAARNAERLRRERRESPEKHLARQRAARALHDGRLRREPCHFCRSEEDLEMHHPDYSQPLRVYWLCRTCHRKLDGMTKIGVANNAECT